MAIVDHLRALPFPLRVAVVLVAALAAAIATFSLGAFPQPLWYHDFADQRMVDQIPNFANVVSNAGFVLAGLAGLWIVVRLPADRTVSRLAYGCTAVGLLLVAFGSGYYHSRPTTTTLYWDRLAMTVTFMALTAAIIGERICRLAGLLLLPVLIFVGTVAVTFWGYSELARAGDLRIYLLVQIVPAVALPLIVLLFRDPAGGDRYLVALFVLYAAALGLENIDRAVFAATAHLVSGHSLKHLLAALAGYMAFHRLQAARA